jgi:hypothetical protein
MSDDGIKNNMQFVLEAWKTTVEVQQHFNTIEMQIRNIAITVLTATIGAAALVYNQTLDAYNIAVTAGQTPSQTYVVELGTIKFSPPDMILAGGLIAWLAFFFMDRYWYHPLLLGAVKHAEYIENNLCQISEYGKYISLSNSISKASPVKIWSKEIHSSSKINIFYGAVAIFLLLIIFFVF